MALSPNDLKEHLAAFMAGGAYMAFWRPVMDATEVVDSDPLWSGADRAWYYELYYLGYMAARTPSPQENSAMESLGRPIFESAFTNSA